MAKGLIKREWNESTNTIVAAWPDNVTTEYSLGALPEDVRRDCAMHGLEQKLFDSIAGDTKKGETFATQRSTIEELFKRLTAGEWTGKRGSSEGPSVGLLAQALARVHSKPIEKITAWLGTQTPETLKSLRADDRVKAAIYQIQAENAAKRAEAAKPEALESLAAVETALSAL